MSKWLFVLFCLSLWSCSDTVSAPEPVSTVDSNLAEPYDTVLPELYIDDPTEDTTFTIALDSTVETILPEDTAYQKK